MRREEDAEVAARRIHIRITGRKTVSGPWQKPDQDPTPAVREFDPLRTTLPISQRARGGRFYQG